MAFESWMGLEVTDDVGYNAYREGMKPILEKYGGGFRYDFRIAETLRSDSSKPINRVFAIYFESKASRENFFSDPEYKKVREKYFTPSVNAVTTMAEFER
ncbi:MAG: DUF1330 domain-containing protein [Spirochaetia bacterium]|nr:DUF1330 domain-containing protein [Spirochaetia bacterium]